MAPEDIRVSNATYVGQALVVTSGTSTHFTTSDVVLQIYEQLYSIALTKQRARQPGFFEYVSACF